MLCIPQTPGTADINLLSSECLQNDKMMFTQAGSITCCLPGETFSAGPSSLRQEIPARSAAKRSPVGLASPPSPSSQLEITVCGFAFESKTRASELKRKSEKRRGSTCKVLFPGFALNIPFTLGFTLKFRNVRVKPGCVPLGCLQRCRRSRV